MRLMFIAIAFFFVAMMGISWLPEEVPEVSPETPEVEHPHYDSVPVEYIVFDEGLQIKGRLAHTHTSINTSL